MHASEKKLNRGLHFDCLRPYALKALTMEVMLLTVLVTVKRAMTNMAVHNYGYRAVDESVPSMVVTTVKAMSGLGWSTGAALVAQARVFSFSVLKELCC